MPCAVAEYAVAQTQALKAQHDLQLANVEAARAVVASTAASFEQNGQLPEDTLANKRKRKLGRATWTDKHRGARPF